MIQPDLELDLELAVVLTHRNQSQTLWTCLKSLWDSKVCPRIILIDDASDERPPIPPWYVDTYDQLKSQRGVQHCRNQGFKKVLEQSETEYVLFCDADIEWRTDALDFMLYILKKLPNDVGYVYCDYERIGALHETWRAGVFDPDRLRQDNFISTMSMCRVSALPNPPFIEDEERFQDWSLWLRLLNAGYRGVYIPRILFTAYYGNNDVSLKGIEHCNHWKEKIRSRYAHSHL